MDLDVFPKFSEKPNGVMLSFPNMHQGRLATCVRRMDVGAMGQ